MAYPCFSCYELVEATKLRRYIHGIDAQFDDLPNSTLYEAFYKIQRCQCCRRHMTRRPCSPYDEAATAPPRTHSVEYNCDCPCRHLLRAIVDKLRL